MEGWEDARAERLRSPGTLGESKKVKEAWMRPRRLGAFLIHRMTGLPQHSPTKAGVEPGPPESTQSKSRERGAKSGGGRGEGRGGAPGGRALPRTMRALKKVNGTGMRPMQRTWENDLAAGGNVSYSETVKRLPWNGRATRPNERTDAVGTKGIAIVDMSVKKLFGLLN